MTMITITRRLRDTTTTMSMVTTTTTITGRLQERSPG